MIASFSHLDAHTCFRVLKGASDDKCYRITNHVKHEVTAE